MKKHIIKYGLEFLVITLGLSLSFFVEYKRERSYKEQLKEQALVRILGNITQDLGDFEFNLEAHKLAIKSSDWILKNHIFCIMLITRCLPLSYTFILRMKRIYSI